MKTGRSLRSSAGAKAGMDKLLITRVLCAIEAPDAAISCTLEDESNIGKLCHVHSSDYAEIVRQAGADRPT